MRRALRLPVEQNLCARHGAVQCDLSFPRCDIASDLRLNSRRICHRQIDPVEDRVFRMAETGGVKEPEVTPLIGPNSGCVCVS